MTTAPGPGPSPTPTESNGGGDLPHTGVGDVLIWFLIVLGALGAGVGLNRASRHRRGTHR